MGGGVGGPVGDGYDTLAVTMHNADPFPEGGYGPSLGYLEDLGKLSRVVDDRAKILASAAVMSQSEGGDMSALRVKADRQIVTEMAALIGVTVQDIRP